MGIVYKQGNQWTVYNTENSDLPHDFAWAIALDDKGGAWFGTGAGPVYRDSAGKWTLLESESFPAQNVSAITLDNKGGIWFGFCPATSTGESPGGYAYRSAQGEITAYVESSQVIGGKWVRSISIDKNGGVWIARYGKVDYIAPDGTRTIFDKDTDLLPFLTGTDSIRVISADKQGRLWIGTTEGGLYYRNILGQFCKYNDTNTWPAATFNSIWSINACANGDLWVASNGGVAAISSTVIKDWPTPIGAVAKGKTWTIKFNRPVSNTQSLPDYIYVTDSDGKKEAVEVAIKQDDENSIEVTAPPNGYLPGDHTLWIKGSLLDQNGDELKQPVKMKFTVGSN
jgi:hypothetical protein